MRQSWLGNVEGNKRKGSHDKLVLGSHILGFPKGSVIKNLPANAGDTDSVPGSGRSPGEGNGKPLHCSCLGNPVDGGA